MFGAARPGSSSVPEYGPFMPGTGSLPPYLAGRAREQTKIESILDILRRGNPPPSPLIFFGPWGEWQDCLTELD